jgi:glycosyltransferase involved in cell wall biosynthesis
MRILLASSSSGSRGGGELYLLYLGRALAQRGHQPFLWASSHPRMDELASGFASFGQVHRSPYQNTYDQRGRSIASYFNRTVARRIAAEWRAMQVDVIHLNKQNLEDGLDLLHAAKLAGVPHLCTIHLTQNARYLRAVFATARDFISRRALREYPGFLVTVLEDRHRDLVEFLGDSRRVRIVPNGVPLLDLTPRDEIRRAKRTELGINQNAIVIVAVGRMVPQKRPFTFLEIAASVHRRIPDARFLWVGDGALSDQWDQRVAADGLGPAVLRLPWQKDVAGFLMAADVFVHVAEFEGLPLAVLEAMSAGLPCAVTANLACEMPFLDGRNSITIGSDNGWLLDFANRKELQTRGAAARQMAEERFSFEKMGASYDALYCETVAERL